MKLTKRLALLPTNRYVLATIVGGSLLIIVALFVRELLILGTLGGLRAAAIDDEQETIGVLLIGLGVLLEGHELWTRRVAGHEAGGHRYRNLPFERGLYMSRLAPTTTAST